MQNSPLAVVMLCINTKSNPNPSPNTDLNRKCTIINKNTGCGALFR